MTSRRGDVGSGVGSDSLPGPDFAELSATSGDKPRKGASAGEKTAPDTRHPTARSVSAEGDKRPAGKPESRWWLHTPTLVTGGLLVVLVEVVLLLVLHLTWWLALNAALLVLVVGAVTVRRLRGQVLASRRSTGTRPAAARPAAVGGARSGASRSGGSAGGGRPGLLSRLTGRSTPGRGGSTSGPSGTSARAGGSAWRPSSLRRLFGGRSAGSGSPRRGLLGRGRGGASTPSAAGGSATSRTPSGGRLRSLLGGGRKSPTTTGVDPKRNAKAAAGDSKRTADKPGARAALSAFGRSLWAPKETAAKPDMPEATKPEPKPAAEKKPAAVPAQKTPAAEARPVAVPQPCGRHGKTPGGGTLTAPANEDGASLQKWGRNIGTIAPVVEELGRRYQQIHDDDVSIATGIKRLATQADTELPVSRSLSAEMESLAAEANSIAAEQEALNQRRRQLRDRTQVLPQTYRREHETDEDRLNTPRNGRAAEKRADITSAEQDV